MNQARTLKRQLASNGITGLALDIDEALAWTIGYWVEHMQEKFGNPEDLSIHEIIARYRYTQNVPYWQTKEAIAWMDQHRNSNEIQEMLPLIHGADSVIQDIQQSVPMSLYQELRDGSISMAFHRLQLLHDPQRCTLLTVTAGKHRCRY